MTAGDRVRLAPDIARRFTRDTRSNGKAKKVNWVKRRGEVVSVGRTGVYVRWDGRASPDPWPHQALVLLPRQS